MCPGSTHRGRSFLDAGAESGSRVARSTARAPRAPLTPTLTAAHHCLKKKEI